MQIFVGWSGAQSHAVALAMRDWLPTVLPFAEPWVSSEDIAKGNRWSAEIARELAESDFGIVCVDAGNFQSPWLNFEAGAIAGALKDRRLAPLLVGIGTSELQGSPLLQFQCTSVSKEDLLKLARSINEVSSTPIAEARLAQSFDVCWPGIEARFKAIPKGQRQPQAPARSSEGALGEKEHRILKVLSDNESVDGGLVADELAGQIQENLTRTKHYISRLHERGLLEEHYNPIGPSSYSLRDEGRSYLVEHELV